MSENKLIPFGSVDFRGETIKEVFFLDAAGDKTFIIFESGKVLVLPVYRECPVQFGMMSELSGDLDGFTRILAVEMDKLVIAIKRIEELKKWPGQRLTP